MLHAVVYNLCLLLIIGSCAKKKQGVSCANPDPATGVCLREETSVADPNDMEAVLQRALQNQETLNDKVQRLEKEKTDLEAQIASGKRPPSDQVEVDRLGEKIVKIVDNIARSSEPQVDTSKVPTVTLKLDNKNNTGMRTFFEFNHVTGVSDIEVSYGGQGNSHVFNYVDFVATKMQLSEVNIPVELRFQFNGTEHCAHIELSRNFDSGSQPMSMGGCQ